MKRSSIVLALVLAAAAGGAAQAQKRDYPLQGNVASAEARAMQAAPRESAEAGVKNFILGIEMTDKELAQAFERNGLKKLDPAKGAKFDPHVHQAMMEQEAPDVEPGAVVQAVQAGYELYGRVIRPAMVIVAPKAAGQPKPNGYAAAGAGSGSSLDEKA